jgi:hypothetical protein
MTAAEPPLGRNTRFFKANAAKGYCAREIARNSEAIQRRDAIRHQALAARFIDRRPRPIGYKHFKATQAKGDRSREPCRSASYYNDVRSSHLAGYP